MKNQEQLQLNLLNNYLSAYNLQIKEDCFFDSIDSTFNAKGDIVIAKSQTNGTGRLNRPFFCANGGIYLCITTQKTQLVTISVASAVLRCINSINKKAKVKWVNDILYKNKKVCGILVKQINGKTVIGVGLNYHLKLPKQLKKIATSLMPNTIGINYFTAQLIYHITQSLNKDDNENLSFYKANLKGLGKKITLQNGQKAIFVGINNQANLIYKLKNSNTTNTLTHGDIII